MNITRGVRPMITGTRPIEDHQIQMASIDLTLSERAYCMRASAYPRKDEKVRSLIDTLSKNDFALSPTKDKILYRGQTYLIPLNEQLELAKDHEAKFSPKSSIGRIDTFVRVVADNTARFDRVPPEYRGPLYLEIMPLSFDILVRAGQPLVQMRIKVGESGVDARKLAEIHSRSGIIWDEAGKAVHAHLLETDRHGLFMHIDLSRKIPGFFARSDVVKELSLTAVEAYNPEEFWMPVPKSGDGTVIIQPGVFYLFATCERIRIPHMMCGDIAPYDTSAGEFRSHYAGFFDPGFGGSGEGQKGSVGVMEVRGRERPQRLSHGAPICRMDFEHMAEVPDVLYGVTSHYTRSGPSLAKFFRRRQEIWEGT